MEKIQRWEETVAWANDNGCLELVRDIPDHDFYFGGESTAYAVGPAYAPMYRPWDFDCKLRPPSEEVVRHLETLKSKWAEVVGPELALVTRPVKFTGEKARRLLVFADGSACPPWGGWACLSSIESERRTFTRFRTAINVAIAPHRVDHVDFVVDAEPMIPPDVAQKAAQGR